MRGEFDYTRARSNKGANCVSELASFQLVLRTATTTIATKYNGARLQQRHRTLLDSIKKFAYTDLFVKSFEQNQWL